MFDVGFSELVVVALVALIVIGPERLPKVARTVGVLLGRLQRYVNDVKSDINREIQLDELKKMQEQLSSQMSDMQTSVTSEMRTVEASLNQSIAAPASVAGETQPPFPEATSAAEPLPLATATEAAQEGPEQQLELGLAPTSDKLKV